MPTIGSGRIQSGTGLVSLSPTVAVPGGSNTSWSFTVSTPAYGLQLYSGVQQTGNNVILGLNNIQPGPGITLSLVNDIITISSNVTGIQGPPGESIVGPAGPEGPSRWEMAIYNNSTTFTNNQVIAMTVVADTPTLPANLTGSQAYCANVPTDAVTISIHQNSTLIGTINFASAASIGTFTFASELTLALGDVLTFTAPGSADNTFGLLSFTIVGTRP